MHNFFLFLRTEWVKSPNRTLRIYTLMKRLMYREGFTYKKIILRDDGGMDSLRKVLEGRGWGVTVRTTRQTSLCKIPSCLCLDLVPQWRHKGNVYVSEVRSRERCTTWSSLRVHNSRKTFSGLLMSPDVVCLNRTYIKVGLENPLTIPQGRTLESCTFWEDPDLPNL